jgi:hypothetical protein
MIILSEYETVQFCSEIPADAGSKRCGNHVAIRRLPALSAEIDDVRMGQQILRDEACICIAFDAP